MPKIVLLTFLFWTLFTPLTQAQEPEATCGEITIEKKNKDQENSTQILQNLERLAQDQQQKEQIKEQYQDAVVRNRGFIAQVAQLKDHSFKIITLDHKEAFIAPDKSTTIVKKGQSTTGENCNLTEWLAIDDWLVLIGVQNGDLFQPRRILVSSESLEPTTTFVYKGNIKSLKKDQLTLTILGQEEPLSFKLTTDINIVNQDNETVAPTDLPLDVPIIAIGLKKDSSPKLQTLRLL